MADDVDRTPSESGVDGRAIARRAALFVVIAAIAAVGLSALPGIDEVRDRLSARRPAAGSPPRPCCSLGSMLGFVRALWAAFDRVDAVAPRAGARLAEQGANVLLPAGGAGGPAFGAFVMRRVGVPGRLADQRHAALFLATSAVGFVALVLAGTLRGDRHAPRRRVAALATLLPGRAAPRS